MSPPDKLTRLTQLEGYLREDPGNLLLLADVFDAAMQAGQFKAAQSHLLEGQALAGEDPAWRWREAHWLIAQNRLTEADALLRRLAAGTGTPDTLKPVLAHDIAYVALRSGDAHAGIAVLSPWLEPLAPDMAADPALQTLWLRLLHRAGRLEDAMRWADPRWQVHQLPASAAGAASLVALDSGDHVHCMQWSEFALQQLPSHMEALVARASMALAQRDPASAHRLLDIALRHHPQDGRAWSAQAFAHLLEMQLPAARECFAKAVHHMPGHIGTWHGLGWTALLQHDLGAARQAFEAALALDRNFAESHGGLAVVLLMQGNASDANDAIARATRLDRGNLSARYAQALADGEIKDADALKRVAERLLAGIAAPLGGTVLDLMHASGRHNEPPTHNQ